MKNKSILLFYLSTLNSLDSRTYEYIGRDNFKNKTFNDCVGSLEPVSYLLLDPENCSNIDMDIIMMCTKETKGETEFSEIKKISAYDYYIKRITEKYDLERMDEKEPPLRYKHKESGRVITFHSIDIESDKNDSRTISTPDRSLSNGKIINSLKSIEKAVDIIKDIGEKNNITSFYLAANGGFRDAFTMLQVVTALLKYVDINVTGIYSTEIPSEGQNGKIVDFVAGELLGFATAISEFKDYGSIDSLARYYQNQGIVNVYDDPVIRSLSEISEALQLCNTTKYEESIKNTYDLLKKETIDGGQISNLPEFHIFKDMFIDDMNFFENQNFYHLNILERCIDKKMYNQALAIVESKMPEDFYRCGIVYFCDNTELFNEVFRGDKRAAKKTNSFPLLAFNWMLQKRINSKIKDNTDLKNMEKSEIEAIKEKINQLLKAESFSDIGDAEYDITEHIIKEGKTIKIFGKDVRSRFSPEDLQYALLLDTILLHVVLKKQRNAVFHGNNDEQLDYSVLLDFLNLYAKSCRKLIDQAISKGYQPETSIDEINDRFQSHREQDN